MPRIVAIILTCFLFLLAIDVSVAPQTSSQSTVHANTQTLLPVPHVYPTVKHISEMVSTTHAAITPAGRFYATHALTASATLLAWAPPVRNQGANGSCVTFATTSYRAWLLAHDQGQTLDANGFAPMYQYSQLVSGPDEGTTFEDNLMIQTTQGAEPDSQYSYGAQAGLYDWRDTIQQSDHANAAPYRIGSWATLFTNPAGSGSGQAGIDAIKGALDSGAPVLIGIPVYDNFERAGTGSYPSTIGMPQGQLYGYHAVLVLAYDSAGITFENSWSASWDPPMHGFGKLSWDFVGNDIFAAYTEYGPKTLPTPIPTSTPVPTATMAPSPTATPTIVPTDTPTPAPLPTVTPRPTVTPTPRPHHHRRGVPLRRRGGEWPL